MKGDLIFEESTHTYKIGGVIVPSVTTLLKPFYNFSAVDPVVLRRAAEFGTNVHKAVELHLLGSLDHDTLDPDLRPCLDAFCKFARDYDITDRIIGIETRLCHRKRKFAGTMDLILDDGIVDIKTREFDQVTDPLQMAGYDDLVECNAYPIPKRKLHILTLRRDGSYTLTNAQRKQAKEVFRSLVAQHWINDGWKRGAK